MEEPIEQFGYLEEVVPPAKGSKPFTLKQCSGCLTMKHFSGDTCIRCSKCICGYEEGHSIACPVYERKPFASATTQRQENIYQEGKEAERIILKGERNRLMHTMRMEEQERIIKIAEEMRSESCLACGEGALTHSYSCDALTKFIAKIKSE